MLGCEEDGPVCSDWPDALDLGQMAEQELVIVNGEVAVGQGFRNVRSRDTRRQEIEQLAPDLLAVGYRRAPIVGCVIRAEQEQWSVRTSAFRSGTAPVWQSMAGSTRRSCSSDRYRKRRGSTFSDLRGVRT